MGFAICFLAIYSGTVAKDMLHGADREIC